MTRAHATRAPRPLPGDASTRSASGATGRAASPSTRGPVSAASIAHVQRTAGNAAATRFVQRQTVEDESGPYAGAGQGGGGVDLPPPEATGTGAGEADGTTSASAPPTHRTLRRGSRGDDVADLQARLNTAGAAAPALVTDGVFGRLTKAAAVQYQSGHGLVPDGIVGPLTWASLDASSGGGGGGGGGTGPGPGPQADPLAGIVTIAGHGASAAAVARARAQAIELYGSIAPANRQRMQADPVTIDVIPHNKKLTELPEYAHLAGTTTFDGRLWDNVRGIQTTVNGVRRVAVAEEDLVTVAGTAASYGSGFLEAHEGGHGLQFSGLTAAQQGTLATIYAARLTASGPITQTTPAGAATAMWLNPAWYSAANKEEYFANSVAAYHEHPYTNGTADQAMYTRAWLQAHDLPMYQLLQVVYQRSGTP
jgi:peptidoglycan hydrolase-like protein with peptidoglycan-binding domain